MIQTAWSPVLSQACINLFLNKYAVTLVTEARTSNDL